MNIKAIASRAVATAFRVVSYLPVACNYRQPGTVAYNTTTGGVTPNYTTTPVNALFTFYEAKESANAARREGERRVIIQRSEMTGIVPSLADAIVDGSVIWKVVDIEDDSTDATWCFIVKRGQA